MPFDVTLSDGTTVNGIPDGTTKTQLATKLWNNGVRLPEIRAALPRAPGATASVLEIPRAVPGAGPDTSKRRVDNPSALDVLKAHPLGGLEDVPRVAFGIARGMNEPLLNALESVPSHAVQNWAAKNIAATDAQTTPVERGVGSALLFALPGARAAKGAESMLRAVPDATNLASSTVGRLLSGTAGGGALGALLSGSGNPNKIDASKVGGALAGATLGGSLGLAGSAIPLVKTYMMASGKTAKEAANKVRQMVGDAVDKYATSQAAREAHAERLVPKAEASAKKALGREDVLRSALDERTPHVVGTEAQQAAIATQAAREAARSAAIEEPLREAFETAAQAEGAHHFISDAPAYRQMISDLRKESNSAKPGSKLAKSYADILKLVSPASNVNDAGVVTETPITFAQMENLRRELADMQNPDAEGYDALKARLAGNAYAKLKDVMAQANPAFGKYLETFADKSAELNAAQNRIGTSLTAPQKSGKFETGMMAEDAANVPAKVFANPDAYGALVKSLGDPARAQKLARNYFSFQMRNMNAPQAANFIRSNQDTMRAAHVLPEFEKFQARLAQIEPYINDRGELSKQLVRIADKSGDKARSYATLFTTLQSAKPETVAATARSAVQRLQTDGFIKAPEAMEMHQQINAMMDEFKRTQDARALRAKVSRLFAVNTFLAYMVHRYIFDQMAGFVK